MDSYLLNLIVVVPVIGAILIAMGLRPRLTALVAGGLQALLALVAYSQYDGVLGGFQFGSKAAVVPAWGLNLLFGADGLSLLMLLLTGIVTFCAVLATGKVEKRERLFFACVLLVSAGAAGAFASLDLFFFYAFHELALIPTFLLIGLWGSGERHIAAWKITLYLALGSLLLLVGLVDLYFAIDPTKIVGTGGLRTFDLSVLLESSGSGLVPALKQGRPFLLMLLGFGVLVSLFPFHTWAPQAYASAPAPVAMLHAGVLKKFGLYGLMRVALPLLPEGAREWQWLLLLLLCGNILYVGLVTISQKKLDLMLGYSSVMHMGYIFLGIAGATVASLSGAALLMFAHGLSIALLFAMVGILREKCPSLVFASMGGLAKPLPVLAYVFGVAAFASIGLPGFANFASEVMVFLGTFGKPDAWLALSHIQIAVIIALWGVVISAVYMLRAFRTVFLGETARELAEIQQPPFTRMIPVIVLLGFLTLGGVNPGVFLTALKPAIHAMAAKPAR
jgi:NADH-quinone oxidoreductase subunit M